MILRPLAQQTSLVQSLAPQFAERLRATLAESAALPAVTRPASLWQDQPAFAASLDDACQVVLRRALDPAFLRRQQARFGPEQPLDAFAARLLSTQSSAGAAHAVAELRFKRMDPTQPFVELALLTPDALPQLVALVGAALEAFAPYRAGKVRVAARAGELEAAVASGLCVEPDLHCVAAPLRVLRQLGGKPLRIELRPIEELEGSYRRHAELYASFGASCPHIARELYCSSQAEFSEMVAHGRSFEAFCEGRWAGLVAATPAPLWGQPGWSMQEEFLSAEFRGRGLGLELQRALVQRLEGEPGLLWGTIHSANQPSLATALRNGRRIVQTHYWLSRAVAGQRSGAGT